MATFAVENWRDLDGLAASLGIDDLRTLGLDRFCNFLWWVMVRHLESEQEIETTRAKLWRPPPQTEAPAGSPWAADTEMAAFASLRAALSR